VTVWKMAIALQMGKEPLVLLLNSSNSEVAPAFKEGKSKLIKSPVLQFPDWSLVKGSMPTGVIFSSFPLKHDSSEIIT